ncbi:MAG: DUF5985 family protein [Gammaproteobacteria bacterium]
MIQTMYALCALVSVACAAFSLQQYLANGSKFLRWATLCFMGLAVNNILIYLDDILHRGGDFFMWRAAAALAGMTAFIYGLIWDWRGPPE